MKNEAVIEKIKQALLCMQRLAWEQGVSMRAFFEQGDLELGILHAKEAVHRQVDDGRMALAGETISSPDPGANGIPVLWAYNLTKDPAFLDSARKMAQYYLEAAPRTSDGILTHFTYGYYDGDKPLTAVIMVDGIYHLAPFLAATGHPDMAMKQIRGFKKLLYNETDHVYHQQWDTRLHDFRRKAYWGGGNGWVVCALAWTYELLPAAMQAEKEELKQHMEELVAGMLSFQRSDGHFYDVLDDPNTPTELTSGLMLAFSLYEAVRCGMLDDSYLPHADQILALAFDNVDEYGILHGVADAPTFERIGTSPEAQAFLLMADAAQKRLANQTPYPAFMKIEE